MSIKDFLERNNLSPTNPCLDLKYGVSASLCECPSGVVTGVRYKDTDDTSGWYIWDGEYSEDAEFFRPSHRVHVVACRPEIEDLLSLPEGVRFIFDLNNEYLDIWFDKDVLGKEHRD